MENFKEKLRVQNLVTAVCAAVLAIFALLGLLGELGVLQLTPTAGDSHWQSLWRGFLTGATLGIFGLMVFFLTRSIRALKDEKALKKLYIQEHDERNIQIWTAARASAMQVFLLVGLAACIVAGYFSVAVSLTILACVLAQSLLGMGFKLYYGKKF